VERISFDAVSVPELYQRLLVPAIFAPWAERLIAFAGVSEGDAVLDVAAGTGVVSAAALERVGPSGRVVATDVSPGMLEVARVDRPRLETLVGPADDLPVKNGSFDVALCQQGFQFLPDKVAAAAAMRRSVRSGGTAALAVWRCGTLLEPFDVYGRALQALGAPEPFPRAYAYDFCMAEDEVRAVLESSGLEQVEVGVETLEITWSSLDDAVRGIGGTPYGPAAAALDAEAQARLGATLRQELRSPHPMHAVLARGVVP
jgi:SAM-dependent methyltransferase